MEIKQSRSARVNEILTKYEHKLPSYRILKKE